MKIAMKILLSVLLITLITFFSQSVFADNGKICETGEIRDSLELANEFEKAGYAFEILEFSEEEVLSRFTHKDGYVVVTRLKSADPYHTQCVISLQS